MGVRFSQKEGLKVKLHRSGEDYLKTILIAWDRKGIRTREAAEADAAAPVSGRAATHKKSDYSNSELEKLEVDLNAEGRRL